MRIVFIGCVSFSEKALLKLLELDANVVGVVTKEKSTYNSDFSDLSEIAQKNNIPFKYVNDVNHPNNIEWISEKNPNIIFCFGWSSLIKSDLLKLTKLGVVGFHPAMLPMNRGRHPLIWAKVLGLQKTGSSYFFMNEGADTGDILDQQEFDISFEDDINDIYNKMTGVALKQIETFLPKLISNSYRRKKQIEDGNTWRKRSKSDGLVDFRMNSASIINLIRGLTKPFPGAHCLINGIEYKIWKCELGSNNNTNFEPGKILLIKDEFIEVKTGDGSIFLLEHELPNLNTGEYI
jgi:methionyl-tRNA formyltransferase